MLMELFTLADVLRSDTIDFFGCVGCVFYKHSLTRLFPQSRVLSLRPRDPKLGLFFDCVSVSLDRLKNFAPFCRPFICVCLLLMAFFMVEKYDIPYLHDNWGINMLRLEELRRLKEQNRLAAHERLELANLEMKKMAGQLVVQEEPHERLAKARQAEILQQSQLAHDVQALKRRNGDELKRRQEELKRQQEKVRSPLSFR